MDSFFDEVDDELLQIFSLISSPMTAAPFFQPPLSPPNVVSDLMPEQIVSDDSCPMTAAPFFQHPFTLPSVAFDPTSEQIVSQVPEIAASFFQYNLSSPNAASDPTSEQIVSQVPATVAPFFQYSLSPPNAASDPTSEQIVSQVPVTVAPIFQYNLSPPKATSDLTSEPIFSQVSCPVTAAPFFQHTLSPFFQPPLSSPGTSSDPSSEQFFSFVSSPVTAAPFFQPPSSPPGRTSDPTLMALDSPKRRSPATKTPNEKDNRKIMHRDVERQRRREMSSLYSSIRSLLPPEYLKGKRSVSDQLHEAVNYIKHMQANIRELVDKRDALKRLSRSSKNTVGQSSTEKQDLVMVNPSMTGGRLVLTTAISNNCLPLSTLILALEDDGIHTKSCFSSIGNDRSVHTMECEMSEKGEIDWSELQMRLTNLARISMNQVSSAAAVQ